MMSAATDPKINKGFSPKDKPKNKTLEKEREKFLKQDVFSLRQLEEAFTVFRNLNKEYERYAPNAIQKYLSDYKIKITENKKDNTA